MCGIIGYIGNKDAAPILVDSLAAMEYRGYDSAGVAVNDGEQIVLRRSIGKVASLGALLSKDGLKGHVGMGHTRWATHGRPSEENAHPHQDCHGKIVVVHNGIIENHLSLKDALRDEGHNFKSDTDTEVIAHLIEKYDEGNFKDAVKQALEKLEGSYSICVMHQDFPDQLIVARNQSPLMIGLGDNENYVASDIPAILKFTRDIVTMYDMELATITKDSVEIETLDGKKINRKPEKVTWNVEQAEKEGYEHFMLKEIFEQPKAIQETIKTRISEELGSAYVKELGLTDDEIRSIDRVVIISCGTSWHAGMVGRRYLEILARIPVCVEYAAEFRYNNPLIDNRTLVIAISQSGETADTLAAVREARRYGSKLVAICNVLDSSLTREVDGVIYTHAGPEIGVASTKAFTSQLAVLYLLAVSMARIRGVMDPMAASRVLHHLQKSPEDIQQMLTADKLDEIKKIAKKYSNSTNFLYLGRGSGFAIALEGALKLKEISYIHAEGYNAGEMKHGPIALIDKNMPVVVLALKGRRYEKIISNIEEIKARDGNVIAIATEGDESIAKIADEVIYVPDVDRLVTPIVAVVPLQLLAYYIAVLRKCDIDQPRNLAKSVTVE